MTDSSMLVWGDVPFALMKLDGMPLDSLLGPTSSALSIAVRRVVSEAAERVANYAAFSSAS